MKRETRALVADDSRSVQSVLEKILVAAGIPSVAKAGTGLRAVELFEESLRNGAPFNVVLLDIVMPEMDGQEALRRIRALESGAGIKGGDRATIIMVSSLHSTDDMIQALIEGDCTDYLVKPFSDDDLLGMLVRYGFEA